MKYIISYENPLTHCVHIALELESLNQDKVYLQLPAWRPGRYEIANFSKNIIKIEVTDNYSNRLKIQKISKDRWAVDSTGIDKITVDYVYYAFKMDAGNSWLDDKQLYLNFINCLIYAEDRLNEACKVELKLPEDYMIATGLKKENKHHLWAESYYQLVDSPVIASNQLNKYRYKIENIELNIWIQGEHKIIASRMISDFEKFTKAQIAIFGEFPSSSYDFLIQALPYKHYHGVEHQNSTTITLGPANQLNQPEMYNTLLGISSHELFHTWNIIRIRPKELQPYDFRKENYFETGYVAEGFTTYYGDLLLVKSGVLSKEWYLIKLNKILQRHFDNFGRNNMSVIDSSLDLWIDGYDQGVPNRNVSIYNEGAIIALILDLLIRVKSEHYKSLDDIMRKLWNHYKTKDSGYDSKLIISMLQECANYNWDSFFDNYIYGKKSIVNLLRTLLKEFGLEFCKKFSKEKNESHYGFRVDDENYIIKIEPQSISEDRLSIGDRVENIKEVLLSTTDCIDFYIIRNHKPIVVNMCSPGEQYFIFYEISKSENCTAQQTLAFNNWLL